jgi:hypothetical protein
MKLLSLVFMVFLMSCASKEKVTTDTLGLSLGNDGFAAVSFNIIEVKKGKKISYVVNGVLAYEAPGPLKIQLEASKLLSVSQRHAIASFGFQLVPTKMVALMEFLGANIKTS